jgi:hypothetical protein
MRPYLLRYCQGRARTFLLSPRLMKKFSDLSIQERIDALRRDYGEIIIYAYKYCHPTSATGLFVKYQDNHKLLTYFPHYTVAVLDEKPLPEKSP